VHRICNKREAKLNGHQLVGLSFLVPRVYILMQGIGCWNIVPDKLC